VFLAKVSDAGIPPTLERNFNKAIAAGGVTGAQVAAFRNGGVIFSGSFGTVEPASSQAVVDDTVFLIGSCSKPFASVSVLSLIEDPACDLALDSAIDQWLPAFQSMELAEGGKARRAPTVEELLNHRAGLFSQKVRITPAQARWLYRFDHSLARCVDEVSRFPLLGEPGTRFAYSGAGYCVLGRVAELAAGKDFEMILQESICGPVGLKTTTYFPNQFLPDATVAVGFQKQKAPHQLGAGHLFPLIGGSLYSTAIEMAKFADAVALEWNDGEQGALKIGQAGIRQLAKLHPDDSEPSGYGLGWTVASSDGEPSVLSHSGSLQSYRAWIAVDLNSGTGIAACWTLGHDQKAVVPVVKWLQRLLASMPD